ncbi:MAG: hypothetical protein MUO52_12415 [Desulfobacterales bacterium]|nr:hypothetical protein [Desulfobacterales bacterium]
MKSEHLEKRFGIIAVEKGFVTPAQVLDAMEIQFMENMEQRRHRSIGEILSKQGLLTQSQVKEVLESMDIPI